MATATITIQNRRVTASADVKLEDGTVLPFSIERGASEIDALNSVKAAVQAENVRRALAGGQPLPIPTDEQLVPALAILGRLVDIPRTIDV